MTATAPILPSAVVRGACDDDCDGTGILPSVVVRAACDDDCDGIDTRAKLVEDKIGQHPNSCRLVGTRALGQY
jgi:hypothetical protein